jgi:NifB/MoaA-like Fe-S oxidoreductase
VAAPNTLFGRNVTVSGLLSGNCVYSAVGKNGAADLLLLPPDILNTDGVFLDDMSVPELESRLGVPVMVYAGSWARVFARLRNIERA